MESFAPNRQLIATFAVLRLSNYSYFAIPQNLLADLTYWVLMSDYDHSNSRGVDHENDKRILPDKTDCVYL